MTPVIFLVVLAAQVPGDSGFLTVKSNMPGISVYLEGDYVGRAPVENHAVKAGEYSLSIISNDSLENVYWHLRQGGIGEKLSSAWTLAAINAGTHSVSIKPGQITEVFIDWGKVANARTEAKTIACCGVGGLFGLGAAIGFLVHWIAFR